MGPILLPNGPQIANFVTMAVVFCKMSFFYIKAKNRFKYVYIRFENLIFNS